MHFLFMSYAGTSRKHPLKQEMFQEYTIEKSKTIKTETSQYDENQQIGFETEKKTKLINSALKQTGIVY